MRWMLVVLGVMGVVMGLVVLGGGVGEFEVGGFEVGEFEVGGFEVGDWGEFKGLRDWDMVSGGGGGVVRCVGGEYLECLDLGNLWVLVR